MVCIKRDKRLPTANESLLARAQVVIDELHANGLLINQKTVAKWLHVSSGTLRYHGDVAKLVNLASERSRLEHRALPENILLARAARAKQQLAQQGLTVTLRSASRILGIDHTTLRAYPMVRSLILDKP